MSLDPFGNLRDLRRTIEGAVLEGGLPLPFRRSRPASRGSSSLFPWNSSARARELAYRFDCLTDAWLKRGGLRAHVELLRRMTSILCCGPVRRPPACSSCDRALCVYTPRGLHRWDAHLADQERKIVTGALCLADEWYPECEDDGRSDASSDTTTSEDESESSESEEEVRFAAGAN